MKFSRPPIHLFITLGYHLIIIFLLVVVVEFIRCSGWEIVYSCSAATTQRRPHHPINEMVKCGLHNLSQRFPPLVLLLVEWVRKG